MLCYKYLSIKIWIDVVHASVKYFWKVWLFSSLLFTLCCPLHRMRKVMSHQSLPLAIICCHQLFNVICCTCHILSPTVITEQMNKCLCPTVLRTRTLQSGHLAFLLVLRQTVEAVVRLLYCQYQWDCYHAIHEIVTFSSLPKLYGNGLPAEYFWAFSNLCIYFSLIVQLFTLKLFI